MEIKVYSVCHIGKIREKNQDNFYCNGIMPGTESRNFKYGGSFDASSPLLFGVFDGMGGHLYGERASLYAVQTCEALFSKYKGGDPFGAMNEICFAANKLICDEMENVVKGRMGSTASMLLFEQGGMFVCNLGDSPVFLLHRGKLRRVSCEHTERRNYEQIFGDNYDKNKKFRLTQHLGIFPNEMELSPYNSRENIETGDRFLICSDGVTDMISDEEIRGIIMSADSAEEAAERLLNTALDNGGRDNITIILGEINGEVPKTNFNPPAMNQTEQTAPAYNTSADNPQMSAPGTFSSQAPSYNYAQNSPAPEQAGGKTGRTPLIIIAAVLVTIAVIISGILVFRLIGNSGGEAQPAAAAPSSTQSQSSTSAYSKQLDDIMDKFSQAADDVNGIIVDITGETPPAAEATTPVTEDNNVEENDYQNEY